METETEEVKSTEREERKKVKSAVTETEREEEEEPERKRRRLIWQCKHLKRYAKFRVLDCHLNIAVREMGLCRLRAKAKGDQATVVEINQLLREITLRRQVDRVMLLREVRKDKQQGQHSSSAPTHMDKEKSMEAEADLDKETEEMNKLNLAEMKKLNLAETEETETETEEMEKQKSTEELSKEFERAMDVYHSDTKWAIMVRDLQLCKMKARAQADLASYLHIEGMLEDIAIRRRTAWIQLMREWLSGGENSSSSSSQGNV